MVPTVRKLTVAGMSGAGPYSCPYQHRSAGVTEMILDHSVDFNYLEELVSRTYTLQRFTYIHRIHQSAAKLQPRLLAGLLRKHAGQSLVYLNLVGESQGPTPTGFWGQCRNHNDLSIGSIREFQIWKTLVTCVDIFVKTRGHGEIKSGTGTVQRLASWLPASLKTLILHQGLEKWDKDVLRLLFRGFQNKKQARLPNLKLINFVQFPKFELVMPDSLRAGCREMGIKIGYTSQIRICQNPKCRQVPEQLENWAGLAWIEALEKCCCRYPWVGIPSTN